MAGVILYPVQLSGGEKPRELMTVIRKQMVAESLAHDRLKKPVVKKKQVLVSRSSRIVRELRMNLTAYSNHDPSVNGKGITASGTRTKEGRTVAVDPNQIPLGSLLYVEGLGYRVAEDTGGAIGHNRMDVFFESRAEALQFGRKRNVKVQIIREGK